MGRVEEWREVSGTFGLYEVSNNGNVRRIYKTREPRQLKKIVNKDGYHQVRLSVRNDAKTVRVHRLVAMEFVPNPNGFPVINHKDEDKLNNAADNLEWCTVKHNTNYNDMPKRRCKSLERAITQMTLDGDIVKEWPSRAEIERQLGYSGGNITMCCKGRQKTGYGFLWAYSDQIERMKAEWGT